jgi:cell division protein FtsB
LNEKKTKKKKAPWWKSNVVGVLAVVCFFVYVAYTLVSQQININNKEAEIEVIDQQTIVENGRKEALAEEKKMVNTPEWIEKYARSEMGYAAPDEIVFIDSTVEN